MKLVVDMNLSPRWVPWLRTAGFEAVHWSVIGRADDPDRQIMDWARSNNCIVFTHDLDFGHILAASSALKPSVIQVRADDTSPEKIGMILRQALHRCATDLNAGALVTVEPRGMRLRLLPL
jgi:predicted nuclease of predicted toxin-antitoxin system